MTAAGRPVRAFPLPFPARRGMLRPMPRVVPAETTSLTVLPFLGGVEMLTARFVTQRFSRHFHEGYAVGCIVDGAMRFHYLGANVVAPRGQVNLVVPGEPHDGQGADDRGWAYRMFYLPPGALLAAAGALLPHPALPHFRAGVIDDPTLARCIALTHRILERPETPALEKETRLLALLTGWIARHAVDRGALPEPGREHRAVALARDYLHAHFAGDPGLADLARAAHLSPFHLVRVFEARLGITPHAYLTQVRVERARTLLAGPDRLADIAAACGFADQAHLTRLFKRHFGVTPGRFRKMLQNG